MKSRLLPDYLDRLQCSNVSGRLFLFFLAMHAGWLAYDDNTMIGLIFNNAEEIGAVVIFVALIGFVDTFINDILPEEFTFPFALTIRHFLLMSCASFFAVGAFLASKTTMTYVYLPHFVGCCIGTSMHAFFDIRRRFKGRK